MSDYLPTIWMNVTTSANWQRAPVGIVRVERSLCDELEKLYGERFKRCVWQDGSFVEWTVKPRVAQPANTKVKPRDVARQEFSPIFPLLPKKQALIAVVQGVLSLTPASARPYLSRFLHYLRPKVIRFLTGNTFSRLRARSHRWVAMHKIVPDELGNRKQSDLFRPGDVLISVGLDWDYSFYKEFYFLRKERHVKVVTCCYDLIPVLYPQYCVNDVVGLFTSYFLDVADGSDLVLCISKQSEKDLNEMLVRTGGARPPTHVFPLGDNVPASGNEEITPVVKAICQEPFILFVSTIERRKNHEVLYRAYHLLCKEGKRGDLPKLVFVGMQGWGVDELMKDIELDPLTLGLIIRLNHVSDTELHILYSAAKFCVFPSLYEGWGLPVGEALSLGKAVISSDRGSLPEVGGDLVRYVDPWSPQAWAEEIHRMATDDSWREQWQQKAKEQYRIRTWVEAALSVKNKIDDAIKNIRL